MPPKKFDFPWRTRQSKQRLDKVQEKNGDNRVLEIEYDFPASTGSSNEGSIRKQGPFIPNVCGEKSISETPGTNNTKSPTKRSTGTSRELDLPKRSAPEKDLTLFATRLAMLEKIASDVGTLGFIWATVVLLGGYAVTLKEIDFWFVTIILVTEGARIFSRSHELEWQHQDAGTASTFSRAFQISSNAFLRSSSVVRAVVSNRPSTPKKADQLPLPNSDMDTVRGNDSHLKRTWSPSQVPLVPFMQRISSARHVSRLLYWMQLYSAMLTIVLSALRLRSRDFARPGEEGTESNHTAALMIFYILTAFEALVFLLERSYWQYQTSVKKILVKVNDMCGLSRDDLDTTRRFFYDVYSKCLLESIFEGLKMDLMDFALTWLQSDILTEQLGGLRVLSAFSRHRDFSEDTLRTICTRQGVAERLLEMITWKNIEEQEIRKTAAELVCKLVKYNRNGVRVAAITGSIEAIFTLLSQNVSDRDEIVPIYIYIRQAGGSEQIASTNLDAHLTGLRIMKHLATDPMNCIRIGNTRGLLSRLISFIDTDPQMLRNAEEPEHRIALVKKSLELLNLLTALTGFGGKTLREEIVRVVYTISNLRNILEYGEAHMMLQELATKVLTSLAMDDELRDAIGRTGGILRNLFKLFFKDRIEGDHRQVKLAVRAGEALTLLALKSEANCSRMLKLKVLQEGVVTADESVDGKEVTEVLVDKMADWEVGTLAISILRCLCAYSGTDHRVSRARIAASIPEVVQLIMERTGQMQEAALGLAAKAVAEASDEDWERVFSGRVTKEALAKRVAYVLENHPKPLTKLPRIRRFCLELAMALVEREAAVFVAAFNAQNLKQRLYAVADTATDVENYYTFSDAIGVTQHNIHLDQLVDTVLSKFQAHGRTLSF